jgi:hypothetical protein
MNGGIKVNENGERIHGAVWRFRYTVLTFVRASRQNWISHVNIMESKRKVIQVFNNNPKGSRLRGRPKNRWWNCVQTDINKFRSKNWNETSRNRADWKTFIKEAKIRFGL